MKLPDNTLKEFNCGWDSEKDCLVLGPHLAQRLNPEFPHSQGFTPLYGLVQDEGGNHYVLKTIIFYTGCKDKGLIVGYCPFCGASLRPTETKEECGGINGL